MSMSRAEKARRIVQINRYVFSAAILVGGFFLLRDFVHAADMWVARSGWGGFLAGPIFWHKIAELIIAGSWLTVAFMSNYEKAGFYPRRMPRERYARLLTALAGVNAAVLVPATYDWTVVTLGTSPATTGVAPIGTGEERVFWVGFLGAQVIAALLFSLLMGRKALRMRTGRAPSTIIPEKETE